MDSLVKDDILKILHNLKQLFNDNKNFLVELDARMGDGDLGLTMSKAFTAVYDELGNTAETDIGKIFMKAGMLMAKAAPSTMGTLMGTGFMRGGKAVSGRDALSTADLAGFFDMVVSSLDVKHPKPHPESLLKILRFFEIEPDEAVYIGDSIVDVDAARAAGVHFIGYGDADLKANVQVRNMKELEKVLL